LPEEHQDKAFYEGIAKDVLEYVAEEDMDFQVPFTNLISPQSACFNFLFPLRRDKQLASDIFKALLPGLETVEDIQFEYLGPSDVTTWLGEPEMGKRDMNQTGVDVAVFWRDHAGKKCISLIEWKYTERSFGFCLAFHQGSVQVKMTCQGLDVANNSEPEAACDLVSKTRLNKRRYWEHMDEAGINLEEFDGVPGCPFQGPLFQLMRQTQLAAFLRLEGGFDYADLISMTFSANRGLYRVPRHLLPLLGMTRSGDIIEAWNQVLVGVPPVRVITVEELMRVVDETDGVDMDWRKYLKDRYEV
jgi:hypothetical protein